VTNSNVLSLMQGKPERALQMLSIPGLRPDKVLKPYRELGVRMLRDATSAPRVQEVVVWLRTS
jgi:hypothetical protein